MWECRHSWRSPHPFRRPCPSPSSPPALTGNGASWIGASSCGGSISVGFPATVAGALLTPHVGGRLLVRIIEVVVAAVGVRLALFPDRARERAEQLRAFRFRLASVAAVAGVFSGLLANSGGFLLAPLYLVVLRLPIKRALATSLAVSAALALPGTVTHWALGHIDWRVVAAYTVLAVPAAYLGARLAIRSKPGWLTRIYGVALLASGLLLFGA
ncbi:hypothetical protein DLE60_20235 [Micromonospora globispora]|uniref:Probable membrane transporter protein n=1 Tax=Micromonospora globispora TaxID=1450148 RepID=A0A317K082_9ACTN|nr:hypothetical protein DLJ46_20480 [Micromonospora globispora]PWU58737.1 hypothetical protein DLE60_20235 [Micromonospora globispora]RQW84623.1 hypothetical protein DKL51_29720 [Micromonospora globispora]